MATLVCILKYIAVAVALGFCPLSKIACSIALALAILLDIWHGELIEKRGRSAMLTKVVHRKVDKIVREERATCQKTSNQD